MSPIKYRTLSDCDSDQLYSCFLEAFSDYVVPMNMSAEDFRRRLLRDGVKLELSVGAFDQNLIVGFSLNGVGSWEDKLTAYDAGTGVVPNFRRHGIASSLFDFMVSELRGNGVEQILLEVITTNQPAVDLYRKLGFETTRQLNVYRTDGQIKRQNKPEGIEAREIVKPDWSLLKSFWDAPTSWQNSIEAIERTLTENRMFGAYLNDVCVGYCAVFQTLGLLMQLAVSKLHRRKGIGSYLLAMAAQGRTMSGDTLKVNNVDSQLEGMEAFFLTNGYKKVIEQYEMLKYL